MGEEIFGIIEGVHSLERDELLAFSKNIDWDYVADKLMRGEIDDKVAVAIVSESLPDLHNGLNLKTLYKEAYPNHIQSLLKRAESHD